MQHVAYYFASDSDIDLNFEGEKGLGVLAVEMELPPRDVSSDDDSN